MDKQEKSEWYQLARESVREQSTENTNVPPPYDHDPTLEYGIIATDSPELNTVQVDLSSRRLSELSDTQLNEYCMQQYELLSSSNDSVDFEVHTLPEDSGMVSDNSKHNGMRLNLQERIDGEISEGNPNPNVHFDANLSPISLNDGSPTADINDTTILLQRAQEANWLSFFSTKDEDGSLKDTEWHSLQSSIMQVISRPEPLGYARCDTGNVTGTKSVTFAKDLPMDFINAPVSNKTEDFIPLQNQNISLTDDANMHVKQKRNHHVNNKSHLYNQLTSKDGNKNSTKDHLGKKIVSLVSNCQEVVPTKDIFIPTSLGGNSSVKVIKDFNVKHRKKGSDDASVDAKDDQSVRKHSATEPVSNVNETEASYMIKDEYVKTDSQTDSQRSDVLFIPSFTSGDNQSIPESLFLQSLSDTSNSLKSDIQRLFLKEEIPTPLYTNNRNDISNNSLAFSKIKDYQNNSDLSTSDLGTGESGNVSLDNTIRKKLAFSAKKKNNREIRKEFQTSKPNLTSSVRSGSLPSYSFSSSLQSTLGSGSFCIRKIVDEKIEISRNMRQYKGVSSTDSTLTNSVSCTGVGIIPQFNLTSLSSGEEKTSNVVSEEGTIPSLPSSFSNPSFQNIPSKPESPVSKLLGSTFKKTEDFLKKLEKLELPYKNGDKIGSSVRGNSQVVQHIHEDSSNVNSEGYEDSENKLPFSSLKKYEDSDGEVLQLSDDEILMEQDIKSASLMEPFVSDTTCSQDGSQSLQLHKTKLLSSGSSKASGMQVSSEEELTLTDLDLDKCSNSTIAPTVKTSYSTVCTSGNLETITEVSSPDKGKFKYNKSDVANTLALVETPRYVQRTQQIVEKKYDSSTSSLSDSSDDSNRNLRRFEKLQKKIESITQNVKQSNEAKDLARNNNETTSILPIPKEFPKLQTLNNNFFGYSSSDEYINLKEGNASRKYIPHSNPTNKLHGNTTHNPKPTLLDKSHSKENSRNEQLETSLNKLLHEYEKPVHGKFSESPLIRKLELLSKILREAKIKRYNSYTSDSSETSPPNYSQSQSSILDRKNNKNGSSLQITRNDTLTTSENTKPTSSSTYTATNTKAKVRSASTVSDKTVTTVCPNCCRRDVGTNCPTPCVSSDESSCHSKPLTLQTWTQTNEQSDNPKENHPQRKGLPRKRWSDKEDSIEINTEAEANKDEPKIVKRERKNTFVLSHPLQDSSTLDSNSPEEKAKGSTAWFLSFGSDDSQTMPLANVPDLSAAYLESRRASQDGAECDMSNANARIGLQEAFQLHKKDFIKLSNERVQNIKDIVLQEKHPPNLLKQNSAMKRIRVEIHKERKPKKVTKIQRPVTVKKAWVPKKFTYGELNEEKLRQKRSNRLKMKNYDLKIREGFLKRTRVPNSRKNIYFIERH